MQTTCTGSDRRLTFKRIPSILYHISPTDEEYGIQLNHLSTPNLPIDARRYVDFIALNGKELRYNYPNLYNIGSDGGDTREQIRQKLTTYIEAYARDMNTLIDAADPSSLTGEEKLLAVHLSDSSSLSQYPSADVDFMQVLQTNTSAFDQLVDALYWIEIDNLPKKYEYALIDSLEHEGGRMEQLTDPSQKELYEIGYFVGSGTPTQMYLDIFPEDKTGIPTLAMDIQAVQSDTSDTIIENKNTVARKLQNLKYNQ